MYGYDGGKRVKGRKRFILVDTLGLVLAVIVTEANFPERLGGAVVVMEAAEEERKFSRDLGRSRFYG